MPTHEECYWAMLALESLSILDRMELRKLLTEPCKHEEIRNMKLENSFRMHKGALNTSPKEWLGEGNDPANLDYQKRRRIANKLFDKVMSK